MKRGGVLNFFTSVFFRFSIVLSSFAIFLISSYLYGPEGRGVISFLGSFYFAASLILSFGLGRVVYQRISLNPRSARQLLPAAVSFIYAASAIGFVIVLLISIVYDRTSAFTGGVKPYYFVLLYGIFSYNLWLNFSNYLFSAIQKTGRHEIYIFSTRIIQVVLLATLVLFKGPLEIFLFIYGISGFLIFVVESRILLSEGESDLLSGSLKHLRTLFSDIYWPYVDSVAQAAYPLVIFLIGMVVSSVDLGNYHFSLQMISTLLFPFTVIQVKVQESLAIAGGDARKKMIRNYLLYSPVLAVALMLIGLSIPYLLPIVGLSSFSGAVLLLKVLLLSVPLQGGLIVFQGIWVGLHKARLSSFANLIYGSTTILIALTLVSQYGVWAGVLGTFVASMCVVAGQLFILRRMWIVDFKEVEKA